jgi:formylmethanofuran dehydrogenase subunit C
MTITLTLHTTPDVPLEADVISPDRLAGQSAAAIARLEVYHGNQPAQLGDFFTVGGDGDEDVHVEGDLRRVKLLGFGMSHGRLTVHGSVGMHVGAAMRGGALVVEGDAGDWAGAEMAGGSLRIHGRAGHMLGSGYRGSAAGMTGGEIVVDGDAGNEIGGAMRRGLIAIGGRAGDFAGVNMIAGTIVVIGELGQRPGAGLKRGTILSLHDAHLLPTYRYDCTYRPDFVRLYLRALSAAGLPIPPEAIGGRYRRYSGDLVALGKGEVLLWASP